MPTPILSKVKLTQRQFRLTGALTHAWPAVIFLPFLVPSCSCREPGCLQCALPLPLLPARCSFVSLPLNSAVCPVTSFLTHSRESTKMSSDYDFFLFLIKTVPWTSDETTSAILPWVPKWTLILMLLLFSLDLEGRQSSSFHWLRYIFPEPSSSWAITNVRNGLFHLQAKTSGTYEPFFI